MRRLIILVVAGLTVSAVLAEDAPRYIGFIDGHDWLPDGEDEKLAYTTGVIDGLVFAPIFESDAQMIVQAAEAGLIQIDEATDLLTNITCLGDVIAALLGVRSCR